MINSIKNLLGIKPEPDYNKLIKNGAIILDVRSKNEFTSGHIKGSLNIPVDQLNNDLSKIKDKNKVIITCCASGIRSNIAKKILITNGYKEVYNGGGWSSLRRKI